jgi:hypothetical protein
MNRYSVDGCSKDYYISPHNIVIKIVVAAPAAYVRDTFSSSRYGFQSLHVRELRHVLTLIRDTLKSNVDTKVLKFELQNRDKIHLRAAFHIGAELVSQ